MNSDDAIRETTAATFQFERDLESLLLSAFADGAAIEDEWSVELPVSSAPDWIVEIRKEPAVMDERTDEPDEETIVLDDGNNVEPDD